MNYNVVNARLGQMQYDRLQVRYELYVNWTISNLTLLKNRHNY